MKLQRLERALRELIQKRYDEEFRGRSWERMRQHLGATEATQLEERASSWARTHANQSERPPLLDFAYLGQLMSLINREWRLFAQDLPEKRQLQMWMDVLVSVRNDIAHSRLLSDIDLRKADVFCDDLLRYLGLP